jgi:hypothetical protein
MQVDKQIQFTPVNLQASRNVEGACLKGYLGGLSGEACQPHPDGEVTQPVPKARWFC